MPNISSSINIKPLKVKVPLRIKVDSKTSITRLLQIFAEIWQVFSP